MPRIHRPDPTRMRGCGHPYPARKVMVELLVVNHGIHWAGWYGIRNLRREWDKVNAEFFMNKSSATFKRQWEIDGHDTRR
jgi:hypothetical protein